MTQDLPLGQQRRTLGRTKLLVSPIGLGCSGFWGHRRFDEGAAARVVEHALAQGVNLLDTGHNYSAFHAEPRLGRILRPLLAQRSRGFACRVQQGRYVDRTGRYQWCRTA
ncbi:UNVERIFIED_ORG: aryl-alcohol dehydrogenase-like predicted oxidoreductase [Xanthomonas axonopodis]